MIGRPGARIEPGHGAGGSHSDNQTQQAQERQARKGKRSADMPGCRSQCQQQDQPAPEGACLCHFRRKSHWPGQQPEGRHHQQHQVSKETKQHLKREQWCLLRYCLGDRKCVPDKLVKVLPCGQPHQCSCTGGQCAELNQRDPPQLQGLPSMLPRQRKDNCQVDGESSQESPTFSALVPGQHPEHQGHRGDRAGSPPGARWRAGTLTQGQAQHQQTEHTDTNDPGLSSRRVLFREVPGADNRPDRERETSQNPRKSEGMVCQPGFWQEQGDCTGGEDPKAQQQGRNQEGGHPPQRLTQMPDRGRQRQQQGQPAQDVANLRDNRRQLCRLLEQADDRSDQEHHIAEQTQLNQERQEW